MSWQMAVDYRAVALVASEWEEQESDLRSAACMVDGLPAGAFTGPVRGAVATFVSSWSRHLTATSVGAASRAAGLRSAVGGYVTSDEHTALELAALVGLAGLAQVGSR